MTRVTLTGYLIRAQQSVDKMGLLIINMARRVADVMWQCILSELRHELINILNPVRIDKAQIECQPLPLKHYIVKI